MEERKKRNWSIFISSVFFVLGFSLVFSLLGVLLQTLLANISYTFQLWLGRIGGIIIILFGLFTLGLIEPWFLLREHKFKVERKGSLYATSFLFGAAFAVGWTPCVGAILGAILTLAVTNPSSSFLLLLSYTIGLGIPFLIVGLFINQAQKAIRRAGKWLLYFQYFFGIVLIALGILIFTDKLSLIANSPALTGFIGNLAVDVGLGTSVNSLNIFNLAIAFVAGFASFLSPCVLPLLPGFLSYLASAAVKNENN